MQALLILFRGQNLGKLLTGVKVVRADDDGPAGFARGVMLRFALPVSIFFLLNVAFPLIMVALTGQFVPGMAVLRSAGYATPASPRIW